MNAISNLQRIEGTSVSALDICPPRIFAVCSWVVNLNIMMGQFVNLNMLNIMLNIINIVNKVSMANVL